MRKLYTTASISWIMFLICICFAYVEFIKCDWGWVVAFMIVGVLNGIFGVWDIIKIVKTKKGLKND